MSATDNTKLDTSIGTQIDQGKAERADDVKVESEKKDGTKDDVKVEAEVEKKVDADESKKVEVEKDDAKAKADDDEKEEEDRQIQLPVGSLKTFDIGELWNDGDDTTVTCRVATIRSFALRTGVPTPGTDKFLKSIQHLDDSATVNLWMFIALNFGVDRGCPDDDIKADDPERETSFNVLYCDQLKAAIKDGKFINKDDAKVESKLDQETKGDIKTDSPLLNYDATFIVVTLKTDNCGDRVETGEALLIGINQAESKKWIRQHVIAVNRKMLEQTVGDIPDNFSDLAPAQIDDLLTKGRALTIIECQKLEEQRKIMMAEYRDKRKRDREEDEGGVGNQDGDGDSHPSKKARGATHS